METPLLDQFLNGLKEDENGNVIYEMNEKGNTNSITLNYNHRPNRRTDDVPNKINIIKTEASDLKKQVIENLAENTQDQNQSSTIVEYASAFDLNNKQNKETRVNLIKQLYIIYGKEYEYVHDVPADAKGDLQEFGIQIKYPAKLDCTESELITEFNSIWSTINKSWLQFKSTTPKATVTKRFWIHIISEHAVVYPNLCELIALILAISPGTGPVERSFSRLAKICYKDRGNIGSETLEVLYLLANMQVKGDDGELFQCIRDFLSAKES